MKPLIRDLFANVLAMFARGVLHKYQPTVIMVTGSVGKTSTKDAIAAVLGSQSFVRASEKSYNSEFGVPLTILGASNPWTSPAAWIKVFAHAFALRFYPSHYPKILVLEVGADRPGDLERILKIATPDVVVVTELPDVPVHIEAYATPDAVRIEEFAPALALASGAQLVMSADDPYAAELARPLRVRICTYGRAEHAAVRMNEEQPLYEDGVLIGMQARIAIGEHEEQIVVQGAIGYPQLLAPVAAIACALSMGMDRANALKGLAAYTPPAGRGRLFKGLRSSLLIDDSYNSSPVAVREALISLQLAHGEGRRIAVLGDMLELGRYSKEEHEKIGVLTATQCDLLITAGERSRATGEAARLAGMNAEQIHSFSTSSEAARFVQEHLEEGDTVLVKGSQSMRMERVTYALLADEKDSQHLVRQDSEWKKR